MILNLTTKNNNLHHAYCIIGNTTDVIDELEKFFKKELKFSIHDNPDFWYGEYDSMDIEDGRSIKEKHQSKPVGGDKKIFVVTANFITEKAQNAMLKLFEEPRGDTHFFLVLPSLNNIIPTFRSRLFIIETEQKGESVFDVKGFLSGSIKARMELVKKITESVSDEEESKIEIVKFINSLESELRKKINFLKTNEDELKIFEEIEKMRHYTSIQSPSLKMILEHISILLPILK